MSVAASDFFFFYCTDIDMYTYTMSQLRDTVPLKSEGWSRIFFFFVLLKIQLNDCILMFLRKIRLCYSINEVEI